MCPVVWILQCLSSTQQKPLCHFGIFLVLCFLNCASWSHVNIWNFVKSYYSFHSRYTWVNSMRELIQILTEITLGFKAMSFPTLENVDILASQYGRCFHPASLYLAQVKVSPSGLPCRWDLKIWTYFKNWCLFLLSAMMWGAMSKRDLNLS